MLHRIISACRRNTFAAACLVLTCLCATRLAGQRLGAADSTRAADPARSTTDMKAGAGVKDSVHATVATPMGNMGMRPGPLGVPITRMGSGTSWLPDAAPMRAEHIMTGGWELMIHGLVYVGYDQQFGGPRSATQFGSQNWGMFMASHWLGAGRLELRTMVSAEPWTVTERGYPLLLQSGEQYNNELLHDRQHPHDLFMEIVADYQTPITKNVGLDLYGGPAGEPALGPVAFPHRPSASSDPFAPLGHHWQDATHVSFGVLTAGIFTHDVKLEASTFNGREPDQHRADIDLATPHNPTFDSYSTRLSVNPAAQWSMAAWYGYLRSPEQLEPTVSQHRMGASVLNSRRFGAHGQWSSAAIYSANLYSNDARLSNSALVETNLDFDGHNTVFGRAEFVTKGPDDLDVPAPTPPASNRFNIGSFTLGYVREIGPLTRFASAGLGGLVILDAIPSTLDPTYHTRVPRGYGVYVRIRPSTVHGGDTQSMGNMHMGT